MCSPYLKNLSHGGGEGLGRHGVLLGLKNLDVVSEGGLGANLACRVVGKHDSDLDTENTLAHENVANSAVNVLLRGLAGLDHVALLELHALGTLGSELTGNDDLAALSAVLHNVAEDGVASTANGKTLEELELERLSLGLGRETTLLDLLGVELDGAISELEALLHNRGELADALALLTEHLEGAGGTDDDLSAHGGHADLKTSEASLGELTAEKLVELGVENTIGNELALLVGEERHLGRDVESSETQESATVLLPLLALLSLHFLSRLDHRAPSSSHLTTYSTPLASTTNTSHYGQLTYYQIKYF